MTLTLRQLLMLIAVVVFVIAAMGVEVGKLSLIPIGLAIFALAFVLPDTSLSRR